MDGGTSAVFNQTLRFNVDCQPNDLVHIKVKHDSKFVDSCVGVFSMTLEKFIDKLQGKTLRLQVVDDETFKPSGMIEIVTEYEGLNDPMPGSTPASNAAAAKAMKDSLSSRTSPSSANQQQQQQPQYPQYQQPQQQQQFPIAANGSGSTPKLTTLPPVVWGVSPQQQQQQPQQQFWSGQSPPFVASPQQQQQQQQYQQQPQYAQQYPSQAQQQQQQYRSGADESQQRPQPQYYGFAPAAQTQMHASPLLPRPVDALYAPAQAARSRGPSQSSAGTVGAGPGPSSYLAAAAEIEGSAFSPLATARAGGATVNSRPFDDRADIERRGDARVCRVHVWADAHVSGLQLVYELPAPGLGGGAPPQVEGPLIGVPDSQTGRPEVLVLEVGDSIVAVAGRFCVGGEGLEVLLLGTRRGVQRSFGGSEALQPDGKEFVLRIPDEHRVVGFHGSIAPPDLITSLGAYTAPRGGL